MDISLIICTKDRSDSLSQLFTNLEKIVLPDQIIWEILLVDNASKDDTSQRIKRKMAENSLPLKYLSEPVKGKSRALNRALEKAKGDLLIFTDDDLDFSPNWLWAYWQAAMEYPQIYGFCGRVLPVWEGGKPSAWIRGEVGPSPIDGIINRRDFGLKKIVSEHEIVPAGCNAAIRKKVLKQIGAFREDIGPGTKFPFAEDTDFFRRIRPCLYVPEALVYHRNVPVRTTKAYFLKWSFHCARSEVQIHSCEKIRTFIGIPAYLFLQFFIGLWFLLFVFDKQYTIKHLRRLFKCAGQITGHVQKMLSQSRTGCL